MSDFAVSILGNLLASTLFVGLIVFFGWALRVRQQQQLLAFLGASTAAPNVEIVLSNIHHDGITFKAEGTEPTTRGNASSSLDRLEFEAAVALRAALERAWIPYFPAGRSGGLVLVRPQVTIRPSSDRTDTEASQGFVPGGDTNPRFRATRAVVLIGSPIYNRATHDLLGPTREINLQTCPVRAASFQTTAPTLSPETALLRSLSAVEWVRDHDGCSDDDASNADLAFPNGIRGFALKAGVLSQGSLPPGRCQDKQGEQFEQSVVQQISMPTDPTVPGTEALAGLTITCFAGTGAQATAEAVAQLLTGGWHWREHRTRHKGLATYEVCAAWFSRRKKTGDDEDTIDFSSLGERTGWSALHGHK